PGVRTQAVNLETDTALAPDKVRTRCVYYFPPEGIVRARPQWYGGTPHPDLPPQGREELIECVRSDLHRCAVTSERKSRPHEGGGTYPGHSRLLRAERRLVSLQLLVAADLVGGLVPAVFDRLHRVLGRQLARQEARDGGIENHLFVFLVLRDAQV